MSRTRLSIPIGVLLALLAAFIYSGAFDNEFVWDDAIVFKKQLPNFYGFK